MSIIKIHEQGKIRPVPFAKGETLLTVLQREGVQIDTPCGGGGTCGKCAIHTSDGEVLSCTTLATDGLDIYPGSAGANELVVLDTYESVRAFSPGRKGEYGIAIDIGTTTLAYQLVDMKTGRRVSSHSAANSQRKLGADVVTRIKQATEGAHAQLHACVIDDIRHGVNAILCKAGIDPGAISWVAIAGNTTMLHLLQDMPCDTLGVFPFTPVDISPIQCTFADVFGESELNASLIILPGISTFVGADITSGILCCQSPDDMRPNLLIDLGTNGEMALFSSEKILVTSTAAGPAFEAGNISQGVASIPGAIAKVRYLTENNVFRCETIDNEPAIGICGTGVVDIAAELVRHKLADETGRLEEPYFDDGITLANNVTFTQKDMREIQLAKSAVRSGVDILLDVAEIGYNDVGQVFLAGGFGHRMDMDSAVALGLIPQVLADKVVMVGNTSLGGAVHVLLSPDAEEAAQALAARATEVNLSTHPRFNELFMEHMMFE